MRGNRGGSRFQVDRLGSIPAHAGEPPSSDREPRRWGSIPAHAGEPESCRYVRETRRVYPRACGGTLAFWSRTIRRRGLSPRMRGNHGRGVEVPVSLGSIPAHAGEPAWRARSSTRCGVYPRACGGTHKALGKGMRKWGLSPRMRGNHTIGCGAAHCIGSIPAHAGEPGKSAQFVPRCRVYPRACGGTFQVNDVLPQAAGLSPRMRGNPRSWPSSQHPSRVYPRACGGTPVWFTPTPPWWGLSPRMRGNRSCLSTRPANAGSIPAHAGEP